MVLGVYVVDFHLDLVQLHQCNRFVLGNFVSCQLSILSNFFNVSRKFLDVPVLLLVSGLQLQVLLVICLCIWLIRHVFLQVPYQGQHSLYLHIVFLIQ